MMDPWSPMKASKVPLLLLKQPASTALGPLAFHILTAIVPLLDETILTIMYWLSLSGNNIQELV